MAAATKRARAESREETGLDSARTEAGGAPSPVPVPRASAWSPPPAASTVSTIPAASPVSTIPAEAADGLWRQTYWLPRVVYWGIHVACIAAFATGVDRLDLALLSLTYWARMFGITAGYHRYFAHRTYRTSRWFQLVLAVLGCSSTQKGPLWWAGHHRTHHRFSDQPGDVHSPRDGFWWSHQGWIFDGRFDDTPTDSIPDFARFPELLWLNRWHIVPPLALAIACFAAGGISGVVWGYAISTTLLWHSTYAINSLAHRWGSRRFETGDTSRNNPFLALLTMGEGWHNNHHHYQASTRQGFYWWEIDLTYYVLRGLAAIGVVWELREPPASALLAGRGQWQRRA